MEAAHQSLSRQYSAARSICKKHARSFYFSSYFLPAEKRDAAFAVYAFCRLLDDATDEAANPLDTERQINRFVELLNGIYCGNAQLDEFCGESKLAMMAFMTTVHRYGIPQELFLEIAQGCRMDLSINRYQTWEDLRKYCYRVAGVVGLIMCKIFGLTDPAAERQAVLMGEAMQLTNILRDIKEDYARARIYLPLDDLQHFGYTELDLANGVMNDQFVHLMRFEIARARDLYQTGAAGLRHLPNDGSRFTATAMGVIYAGILRAIEKRHYDVFAARARLSLAQKLSRLPAAWRVSRAQSVVPNVF